MLEYEIDLDKVPEGNFTLVDKEMKAIMYPPLSPDRIVFVRETSSGLVEPVVLMVGRNYTDLRLVIDDTIEILTPDQMEAAIVAASVFAKHNRSIENKPSLRLVTGDNIPNDYIERILKISKKTSK